MRFLLMLLLLLGPAASGQAQPPPLNWYRFDAGLTQAEASGKRLLVQVQAEWCKECHKLRADLDNNPRLRALLQAHYVMAQIDLGSEALLQYQGRRISEKQLAIQLNSTWPPVLLFYRPDGRPLGRIFGYRPPDELARVLEQVAIKP